MNKVILIGRIASDPEIRYTQGEKATCIAKYRLAVDRRFKRQGDEQTADFINIIAFGKSGEFIEKYCHKGTKLCVTGRIQTGSYNNKDGQKVYTTDIVAEEQEFAESKNADNAPQNASQSYGGTNTQQGYSNASQGTAGGKKGYSDSKPTMENSPSGKADGFMSIPDGIDEELQFN